MSNLLEVQYVSDSEGKQTGVFVPISLWREIASERETAHLLKSETIKQRLLEAKARAEGISIEDENKSRNAAAIAFLRNKLQEECTDDPEEIRKSQEEFDELKRNLNANRDATGERRVFN